MKLMSLLLLSSFVSLFGHDRTEDKIYLKENEIAIQNNQLHVFIENQWLPTQSLLSDANGIYVLGGKWYEPWTCGHCGFTNPPLRLVCGNCGK
jgi:hypothetical protein